MSFFGKPTKTVPETNSSVVSGSFDDIFRPFHIKQGVVMAKAPPRQSRKLLFVVDRILSKEFSCSINCRINNDRPLYTAKDAYRVMIDRERKINIDDKANPLVIKHLQFYEDVRPPLNGTFSKSTKLESLKTGRNPFKRDSNIFCYDYDSEREWEVEAEGEDIDFESEKSDDDAVDIEEAEDREFLDDGPSANYRNSNCFVHMEPLISVFERCSSDQDLVYSKILTSKMGCLSPNSSIQITFPVDPFCDYWQSQGPSVLMKDLDASSAEGLFDQHKGLSLFSFILRVKDKERSQCVLIIKLSNKI